uniref:Uncharacterized protein n=1 Tax=Anopheles stephensi TaxID=30069 RepID=A0A182YE06_ANOST
MAASKKSSGSIHKIREFELDKVVLSDEFDILQIVGEGWFGKILLVEHRATDTEMVLKLLPKPFVSLTDFYKEFHFSLMLGQHKNIVTTYDVAFETAGFYVFTQEYAPLGDLTSNVSDSGIDLIHRDIKLDNVLVFRSDFARIKLCDFGESRKLGEEVLRRNEWLPYSPPEVLLVKTDDKYKTDTAHDVWQFGIVCFVCLTGCLPWQKASIDDPRYNRYAQWHQATLTFPMKRCPKLFKLLSARACKLFKKFLDPRADRRLKTLSDLQKYLDDRWLGKTAEKEMAENEPDELCPSMYSFHSSVEEKNKLLGTLAQCGIETTVDRAAKKNRIRDWIQSSVIMEEEEEDDSGSATPSSTVSRTAVPGHVSSVAALERAEKKINSTVKEASQKHIDPRTGTVQVGPSEMGSVNVRDGNNNWHQAAPNINGHSIATNAGKHSLLVATHGLVKEAFNTVASVAVPATEISRNGSYDKKSSLQDSGYGSLKGGLKGASASRRIAKSPTLPKRSTFIRSENNPFEEQESGEERDSQSMEFDELETDRGSDGFLNATPAKQAAPEKPQKSTYEKIFFRRK